MYLLCNRLFYGEDELFLQNARLMKGIKTRTIPGFEPVQNLNSDFVKASSAVVITTKPHQDLPSLNFCCPEFLLIPKSVNIYYLIFKDPSQIGS